MRWFTGIVAVMAMVAFAVGTRMARGAEEEKMVLGADSNGKTVKVAAGVKVVEVRLEGNATTGYMWGVKQVEGAAIKQNGEVKYEAPKPDGGRVGQGGVAVATFDVAEAGKATITMEYKRPWEKDKPAIRTFTVTVEVER